MPVEIRPACVSDVKAIFHVRTSVHENHLSFERLKNMGITEGSIAAMILVTPCAWVACLDEELVGFSMIDIDKGSLFAAFVLPSHEGKGIGRQLLRAAEQSLFEKHSEIWLETGRNTRAAGFYRHLGWSGERDINGRDIRLIKTRA